MQLETSSDKFAAAFAVLLLSLTFAFPLVVWLILHFNQNKLKNQQSTDTYGSLYQELRVDYSYALLYNVFFVARRLFFAMHATMLDTVPFF